MQYLVSFVGYDASEDMWLAESQLEHAQELLGHYKGQHALG